MRSPLWLIAIITEMTEEESIVVDLLKTYFQKRNEVDIWAYQESEKRRSRGENNLEVFSELRPKLETIYNDFLTPKERKQTLAFNRIGSSPYFDPQFESIESVVTNNSKKITVRTIMSRNNSETPHEYVFLKVDGKWKLDNRKTYWKFKDKWESDML